MFLILNADDFDIRELLAGRYPRKAILASTQSDLRGACRLANELLRGDLPPALEPAEREALKRRLGGFQAVLLLDPEAPEDQATTKYYSQELAAGGTAYKYRLPCGNWRECKNPDGPCTVHYSPPSKNPTNDGPVICQDCRLRAGPSQLNRDITARRNTDQALRRREEKARVSV